jgi:DNA-binding GntR family transcriptional regulator
VGMQNSEYSKSGIESRALRPSLSGEIYSDLIGRLQRGEIGVEDRLVDVALAAELKVSRMPVREALLRLVHEGYLVGTTRGFIVARLSRSDVVDIFEIRALLEPRAAAMAARNLLTEGLNTLSRAHALAERAMQGSDGPAFVQANIMFRQGWLQEVPNLRLAQTISRFADHVQIIRARTLDDPVSQQVACGLLSDLLDAFRHRDTLSVHDHMVSFLASAKQRFLALNDSDEFATTVSGHSP